MMIREDIIGANISSPSIVYTISAQGIMNRIEIYQQGPFPIPKTPIQAEPLVFAAGLE